MSAMHAAAPALAIFTPSGGGTSEGLSPTMFNNTGAKYANAHRDYKPNRQYRNFSADPIYQILQ